MPKKVTPAVKWFVAKLKSVKRGSLYRVMRRRPTRSIIRHHVEEMMTRDGYKVPKTKYSRVSNLFATQLEARREKKVWEGK